MRQAAAGTRKAPKDHVAAGGSFTGTPQELAQLILDQVTTFPETHHQAQWVAQGSGECGTTMCVAGWAQWFVKGYVDEEIVQSEAAGFLGLSECTPLFGAMLKPDQVREALKCLANGEQPDWGNFIML